MKTLDFHTNLGLFAKTSKLSAMILRGIKDHFDVSLPEYGKNHMPGAITPELQEKYTPYLKPQRKPDIKLFYDLPTTWKIDKSCKNIGIFGWETNKLPSRDLLLAPHIHPASFNWVNILNNLDEVWCLSKSTEAAVQQSGVIKPTKVIHPAIDTSFWKPGNWTTSKTIVGLDHETNGDEISDKFVVGFVGEWCHKNDVVSLIKCVMTGLPANDCVMIFKTHSMKPGVTRELLHNTIKKLKTETYLPKVPNIIVLDDYVSDEEYRAILNRVHVYASISKGESLNLQAIEAMSLGKLGVLSLGTGNLEFFKHNQNGLGVEMMPELAYNPDEGIMPSSPFYSSDQVWGKAYELQFIGHLQAVYGAWKEDKTIEKYKRMGVIGSENVRKEYGEEQFAKFLKTASK
jgi:glycosyltransferase involved in cell wall biosynthesis